MAVIEAIATTYLEADAASVTFSSLGSYEHLQIRMSTRSTVDDLHDMVKINLNSDTGSNYSRHYMTSRSSSTSAGGQTGVAMTKGGWVPASQDFQAPFYGATTVGIYDYRNANKNTTVLWNGGGRYSGGANIYMVSGLWDSTAAVTSIALAMVTGPNFGRGSEFTLYGLNSS